ncbi:MAG: vitamin K epoxide reductase family protein [Anaerolineae bacterium]|nr:vitamin K epoxide reductase family protein [Anaerolineae bacterium]
MTSQSLTSSAAPARRFNLWHLSLLLVLIGTVISAYLTYTELTQTEVVCTDTGAFDCDTVQSSAYSKLAGIPIVYLGLATYLLIGALLLLQKRVVFFQEFGGMLIFGLVLFAWLYSMYLVYLQLFVLKAICQWCFTHEINMTILFVVTCFRLKNELTIEADSD